MIVFWANIAIGPFVTKREQFNKAIINVRKSSEKIV